MTDLLIFARTFREWCNERDLSVRYVTKEALNNTRWLTTFENFANRYREQIETLQQWMVNYDAEAEKRRILALNGIKKSSHAPSKKNQRTDS